MECWRERGWERESERSEEGGSGRERDRRGRKRKSTGKEVREGEEGT